MNIVILGVPACGKGTYSDYIKEKFGFVHISMGDLLRNAVANHHKDSKAIAFAIENGQILDENITAQVFKEYLEKNNLFDGIILDGYPRGILSVELMEKFLNIDAVIKLDVDEEIIKQRVLNRLRCSQCGKNFSKLTYSSSVCDECGGQLQHRVDDTMETLNKRLDVYKKFTLPVLDYYDKCNKLYVVDANCSIEEGEKRIDKLFSILFSKTQKVKN